VGGKGGGRSGNFSTQLLPENVSCPGLEGGWANLGQDLSFTDGHQKKFL
jgi:hypothetical protein